MSRLFPAAFLAALLAGAPAAADPAFDKALRDSLAGVHNSGADLYNQGKDYPGAFRMYEGALRTARPLLAHRPAAQAAIDDGLTAAAKESDAAKKAFLLHEAIEKVRAELKEAPKGSVPPEPKKTVTPEPKKITPEPEPKKSPAPEPKKTTEEPKKAPAPEPKKTTEEPKKAPVPEPKKTTEEPKKTPAPAPVPVGGPEVSGKLSYKGQPVANADVTFAALDRPGVAVVARTGADASYKTNLVAGRYAVSVTAAGKAPVPARFATADTSGLTVVVPAGSSTFDFDLQ